MAGRMSHSWVILLCLVCLQGSAAETFKVKATYSASNCGGVALQVAAISSRQFETDGCSSSTCSAYSPANGLFLREGSYAETTCPSTLGSLSSVTSPSSLLYAVFLFWPWFNRDCLGTPLIALAYSEGQCLPSAEPGQYVLMDCTTDAITTCFDAACTQCGPAQPAPSASACYYQPGASWAWAFQCHTLDELSARWDKSVNATLSGVTLRRVTDDTDAVGGLAAREALNAVENVNEYNMGIASEDDSCTTLSDGATDTCNVSMPACPRVEGSNLKAEVLTCPGRWLQTTLAQRLDWLAQGNLSLFYERYDLWCDVNCTDCAGGDPCTVCVNDTTTGGVFSPSPHVIVGCSGSIIFPRVWRCQSTAALYASLQECAAVCSDCEDYTSLNYWQYLTFPVTTELSPVQQDPLLLHAPSSVLSDFIGGVTESHLGPYVAYQLWEPNNNAGREVLVRASASFSWMLKAARSCPSQASEYACGLCPGTEQEYRVSVLVYDSETLAGLALAAVAADAWWCCDATCPGVQFWNASHPLTDNVQFLEDPSAVTARTFSMRLRAGKYLFAFYSAGYNQTTAVITVDGKDTHVEIPLILLPSASSLLVSLSWGVSPSSAAVKAIKAADTDCILANAYAQCSVAPRVFAPRASPSHSAAADPSIPLQPSLLRLPPAVTNFGGTSVYSVTIKIVAEVIPQYSSTLLPDGGYETFSGSEYVEIWDSSGRIALVPIPGGGGRYWEVGEIAVTTSSITFTPFTASSDVYQQRHKATCAQAFLEPGLSTNANCRVDQRLVTSVGGVITTGQHRCCPAPADSCEGRMCDPLGACSCTAASTECALLQAFTSGVCGAGMRLSTAAELTACRNFICFQGQDTQTYGTGSFISYSEANQECNVTAYSVAPAVPPLCAPQCATASSSSLALVPAAEGCQAGYVRAGLDSLRSCLSSLCSDALAAFSADEMPDDTFLVVGHLWGLSVSRSAASCTLITAEAARGGAVEALAACAACPAGGYMDETARARVSAAGNCSGCNSGSSLTWQLAVSSGGLDAGEARFEAALTAGAHAIGPAAGLGLVRRECPACASSHQTVIYKRMTPTGPLSVYQLLLASFQGANNSLGVDFNLFSSEADALADTNPWQYCGLSSNASTGAFEECGPTGAVTGEWISGNGGAPRSSFSLLIAAGPDGGLACPCHDAEPYAELPVDLCTACGAGQTSPIGSTSSAACV